MCACVDAYLEWCVVLTLPNYRGTEIRQQNGPFIHASALKENVPRSGNVEENAEALVVLKGPQNYYYMALSLCQLTEATMSLYIN